MSNEDEWFYMHDDESHEDMFRGLTIIATDFKMVGAEYVDDAWIKIKYVNALMRFEATNLNIIKGRERYHQMSSTKVMQEICSFKLASKLANDSRNRTLGMSQGSSKALKAKVVTCEVDEEGDSSHDEDLPKLKSDEYEEVLNDYMALSHQIFMKNPEIGRASCRERVCLYV